MNKKEDQKEKKKMNKKLFWSVSIACVVVLVVGALVWGMKKKNQSPEKQNAFQVGQETVTMDEVNVCVLQTMLPIGLNNDMLGAILSDGSSADEYYKRNIYDIIQYYKLECQIAKKQNIELTDDEKKAVDDDVLAFMNTVDGTLLRKYSISKESVEKVIAQQHLAHKVEVDAIGELEIEEQHFCTIYVMLFPKIKTTEEGEFVMEEDGVTPIMLDDSEIAKQKENAQKAREEMLASDDMDGIAKKYKVEDYSAKQSNMQESFDEPFIESAKTLKKGECSDVLDISSCFAVVKMISDQDEEKENEIFEVHKQQLGNEKLIEKRTEWEEEILGKDAKKKTFRAWDHMSLYDYVN